ncbi:PEPxxWA-CTERM sorting domain-containing protein [Sandarakinorhabdus sp.]|uniref:PEPxxWA-CTERM sorting domain-containing protein n=1 Tax=Sandarakinorhabdus sp. TaxID=1916663 RepID=UPI003F6FDC0E
MKSLISFGLAAALAAAPATAATLVADYQLNGSLADALGGPDITNNGGTLGPNGITFNNNQGPSLGGFNDTQQFSIIVGFSFDTLSGYRKILDFKNRTSDAGLYNLSNSLNFFPFNATISNQFQVGTLHRLVFTRDLAGNVNTFVDGNNGLTLVDSSNQATITSVLHFFNDDFAFGPQESSSGFVDYIQIYDAALTNTQIISGAIPEPASWAMLIAGFGLVGATLRRRRAVLA